MRNRIIELQEFRRNGCITLEQGAKYDRDKVARVLSPTYGTNNSTTQYEIVPNSSHQHYLHDTLVPCNDPLQQPVSRTISV